LATSGDFLLATCGDFLMARDTRKAERPRHLEGVQVRLNTERARRDSNPQPSDPYSLARIRLVPESALTGPDAM